MNDPRDKRSLPKRIFRHILGEYLALLACCLLGFLVLFLVSDIFDNLDDFLQGNASFNDAIAFFLMRQPINLVYILPMSILLSLSFVINNLIRHQELTAIRAAGLSIPAATLPVWLCAVLFAGALFVLNECVGPHYLRRSNELYERVRDDTLDQIYGKSACLAYRNRAERRDWFFEAFSHRGRQRGVTVKQFNPVRGGMLWEIRAAEAEYVDGQWVFHQGMKWTFDREEMLPSGEESFVRLEVPGLSEAPNEIFNDLRPLRELSAFDIFRFVKRNPDLPDATLQALKTTFWYRLTFPLSCIVASLYGVGLSIRPQRAGAFRGFAAAVGMIVAYYLATQLAVLLGKHGLIPGFWAAVAPNAAFLAHGVRVVYLRR